MKKALLTLSALALCMAAGVATAKEYKELRFGVDPSYAPFESKAADGFNLHFRLTEDAERFVDTVVPILQTRGVFRREYESDTLRGNLGLPFPINHHSDERPLVTV